jgi:hypothetical protein
LQPLLALPVGQQVVVVTAFTFYLVNDTENRPLF